jgi:hypothetical protein
VVFKKPKNKSTLPDIEHNYRQYDNFDTDENKNYSDEFRLKTKRKNRTNPTDESINEIDERNSFGSDTMLYPNVHKYRDDYANLNNKILSRKSKSMSRKNLKLKLKLNKFKHDTFDEQEC